MVLPAAVSIGKWMTIIGAAGLLLTGGRHNKGFGKITGGLSNIYNNITGYMSDILSYARLLALGLATGVIAQVVNTRITVWRRNRRSSCSDSDIPAGTHHESGHKRFGSLHTFQQTAVCRIFRKVL